MLYETLNHPRLFVIFVLAGFMCGFVFDVGNYVKFLFANKKIPSIFIDFIQTSISLFVAFFTNLFYNYGTIRFFPIIIFMIAFSLERLTLGKLIAKFYYSCYNALKRLSRKLWRHKNDKTDKTN